MGITIWNVHQRLRETGEEVDHFPFLFYKRALKFMRENKEKAEEADCILDLGGDLLQIW